MFRRIAVWAAVVAAIIGGFAWALRPQPIPVEIATVDRGEIEVTVADEGVARIRDVFTVSSPVPGRVLRSPLDEGDLVTEGETVVAMIEPQAPAFLDIRLRREAEAAERSAEAALSLAGAELTRAQAELRFWQTELDRNEALRRTNTISARTLEQTRMELDIREAALAEAEANVLVRQEEVERARAMLIEPDEDIADGRGACCLHVNSPVSGRVLDVIVESEQVVPSGAPLLTVGDPRDMEIVVDLLSADAVQVQLGADARIERWGGAGALAAKVRRVEPAGFTEVSALGIDEQRVNVLLDVADPPERWRGLGHDYRVFVRITLARVGGALRVPMGAVFREGDAWAAFVERDGRAVLTEVTLGAVNAHSAEVLAGLEEGDRVVIHPSDRVENGVRIIDRSAL